ncbi:MAG TPA: glycosyltransferase family 4 protein, partial [Fibrobacteria bacterium]|nr:glycosyltransferase family 4 protein [Fibrobacteria bacterium]
TLVASQSVSAWAPAWNSLRHPKRILHVVHHVAGDSILERLGPLGPSSLRYERAVLACGHYFATPNRATASRILALNPQARVEIIPNGFTPPQGEVAPEQRIDDSVTITFLGRLDHRMKGLDRLLEAFGRVGTRLPDTRLLLAGRSDDSMDAWLSRALAHHPLRDRIEVVANPSDERKYALLDRSDIFCVPSRFEGWCIAAVEAQSRGLPVVATRTDGLLDSVRDGETGILVSNDESQAPSALAQALETLVSDSQRRDRMGEAAARWAGRFTWEAATKATDSLLDEIRQNLG